jgi:hypothetical protein
VGKTSDASSLPNFRKNGSSLSHSVVSAILAGQLFISIPQVKTYN